MATTSTANAGNLPLISYSAQPATRARRASRVDEPATADTPQKARRSSVAIAEDIKAGLMPVEALLQSIFLSLSKGQWTEASDQVSAIARILSQAQRAGMNAGSATETSARHAVGDPNASNPVLMKEAEALGKAGAVATLVRAISLGRGNRELVLRTLWCLTPMLSSTPNKRLFVLANGLDAVQVAQEMYRKDELILKASRGVLAFGFEWRNTQYECCKGKKGGRHGHGHAYAAGGGATAAGAGAASAPQVKTIGAGDDEDKDKTGQGKQAAAAAAPSKGSAGKGKGEEPELLPPKPACVYCCSCNRTDGEPLFCDRLCATCQAGTGMPLFLLSASIGCRVCCLGDYQSRRLRGAGAGSKGGAAVAPAQPPPTAAPTSSSTGEPKS